MNLKKFLTVSILLLTLVLPQLSYANISNLDCSSYDQNGICTSDGEDVPSFKFIETLFSRILNIAIGLISLAILVMIVVGAYRILTSGGDPKGVQAGKDTITWAVIGLVIALSSYFIIQLIGTITGADVTTFEIDDTGATGSGPGNGDTSEDGGTSGGGSGGENEFDEEN